MEIFMKHMTLKEITSACDGTYHGSPLFLEKEISGVVIDSRKVEQDSLFVALRGARTDGHVFIPQTIENGALCVLSEENLGDVSHPYILVNSCRQALKDLAEYYRCSLHVKVVGISGSVGKTSTKEMIASVLSQKYTVLKTEGNFNNEIGLPLTVFQIREEHEIAVLEMGISDFGEMTRLAKIARPDICVITNIGCAHLEQLKSRDGILKAKTEMLAYMNPHGSILFNGDDDKLAGFMPENGVIPLYFGLQENNAFRAEHIESLGLDGTNATFLTPDSQFSAHIPIPGDHMVYNALAGTAVGQILGLTTAQIRAGIESLVPLAGRNHRIHTAHFTVLDDCYNANPASMKSSLDVLSRSESRTVAILGDMFELGDTEKELHYEVGAYAAKTDIQVLVCIGALSREMERGAKARHGDMEIHPYDTKEAFFADMEQILKTGDTILVKASHGMDFAKIVSRLEQF